jgi:pimeloyl-ACP methyl ester carboxylesterase
VRFSIKVWSVAFIVANSRRILRPVFLRLLTLASDFSRSSGLILKIKNNAIREEGVSLMMILIVAVSILLLLIIIIAVYIIFVMSRYLPNRAEIRDARPSDEGKIQKVKEFNLWMKSYHADTDRIPYYVIPGGMGLKSQYLVEGLEFIAETNPIYFYDPRGCGRSESKKSLSYYKWDCFSEELYELIQMNTPNKKVGLIAHSCGGVILYDFFAKYKDMVSKMILLSVLPPVTKPGRPDLKYILRSYPPKDPHLANQWYSKQIRGEIMFEGMFYDKRNMERFDTSETSMVLSSNICVKINKPYDYRGQLANASTKVLVLCGEKQYESKITHKDYINEICREFTDSDKYIFTKSGHFPFFEVEDEFKRVIKAFIEEEH